MEGVIINFRRGRKTVHHYQMIISVEGKTTQELKELIGKKVVYNTGTKKIEGVITSLHGKKALRARFNTGMPGQAIGRKVFIV